MKRSTSQFKTSRSTDAGYLRWCKLAAGALLTMVPTGACQVNKGLSPIGGSPSAPAGSAESDEPLSLLPPFAPMPQPLALEGPAIDIVRADQAKSALVARIAQPNCTSDPTAPVSLQMRLEVNSSVGVHIIDLAISSRMQILLSDPLPSDSVRVDVEGYRMSFPTSSRLASEIQNEACVKGSSDEFRQIALGDTALDQIKIWLEQISPDCDQLTFGANGWTCHLPTIDPDLARQELTGIQSTMISRWSRQPYLLARRLAIGITLAQALKESRNDASLNTFCRIVAAALPIELPATLASRRWQAAVCGKEPKQRRAAALFGLSKTVSEIDFMRQLFERTSRLGFLTLKIPGSQTSGKQILVSLTPESDVADNLTYETARLWANEETDSGEIDSSPKSCWHPVYGEHPRLLNLARQLDMTGDATRLICEEMREFRGPSPFPSTERYFAESVTSETEFIVQNGRAKTLRLPTGKYSYTLRILPDDPEIWDDISQQSPTASGRINWDERRPRPVISNWQ